MCLYDEDLGPKVDESKCSGVDPYNNSCGDEAGGRYYAVYALNSKYTPSFAFRNVDIFSSESSKLNTIQYKVDWRLTN